MKPQAKAGWLIWMQGLTLACLWMGLLPMLSVAQSSILEFSFETDPVLVAPGGSALAGLRVLNTSTHDADGLEISLLSGPIELPSIDPVDVLEALSDTMVVLPLSIRNDAEEGEHEAVFEAMYTYCQGDLCFQIVEELRLGLLVDLAAVGPVSDGVPDGGVADGTQDPGDAVPDRGASPWSFVAPIALAVLLITGLLAGWKVGRRGWGVVLLGFVAVGGLGYGLFLSQDQQAQSIGAVLCTSCVGIEEAPAQGPELSAAARSRIEALSNDVELLFFTAPWCHACPYAKAMVVQAAGVNPAAISYRIIDVDEDRDTASQYGVVQSGRTIVPAILRIDTGDVLFGIEDLEERLLVLLEASQ